MKNSYKLLALISFLAALGCIFWIIRYLNRRETTILLASKAYSIGKIYRVIALKSRGTVGYYTFNVGEEEWTGDMTDARLRDLGSALFKRSFPVIYNTKAPRQSAILIFPDQFEHYKLPFPDSLQWIQDIENK